MNRFFCFLFVILSQTSTAADIEIALTDVRAKDTNSYLLHLESGDITQVERITGTEIPRSRTYGVRKGKLYTNDRDLTDATEVLFECQLDGTDIVIIREEYNSFLGPWKLLAAFSGHPIQVSKIIAITIRDGEVKSKTEITRRESVYSWQAKVFQ